MSFLNLEDKTFLITGVANKKSVATFTAKTLITNGAKCIFTVQNEKNLEVAKKIFPEEEFIICDVEKEGDLISLSESIKKYKLAGMLHSIAFANYSEGIKPFHETLAKDFLQATNISCFSLISLSNAIKDSLAQDASVVTVSISNTEVSSYGYMGPIKAALNSTISYLANSFSEFSKIRFNAVCSGPLKTSASAGIPGYINNYLFAEQLTIRSEALKTCEVANTIAFLLSPTSSGINAANITVDAGMSSNYFDSAVVEKFST